MKDNNKTKKQLISELQGLRKKVAASDKSAALEEKASPLQSAEQALKEAHKTLLDEHNIFTAGPVVVFKWRNASGWPVELASYNVEELFGYTAE